MDSSDQENPHSAKRRKLGNGSTDACVQRLPPYLVIASAHFPVAYPEVFETKPKNFEPKSNGRYIVNITTVSPAASNRRHVRLDAKWLKQSYVVDVGSATAQDSILDDCGSLDSVSKVLDDPNKILLVCYDAELELAGDRPVLYLKILWHDTSAARDRVSLRDREVLMRYTQSAPRYISEQPFPAWDVQEFYQNVHVPQATEESNAEIKIDLLHCQLYPFQRRAVRWLLAREGVTVKASGQIVSEQGKAQKSAILDVFQIQDPHGSQHFFVNQAVSVACSSQKSIHSRYRGIRGGLLGEAMGLGKTVEMIALMCLHNRTNSPLEYEVDSRLKASGATLIITPPAILEQWKQELQMHAPSLRVHHYEGIRANTKKGLKATIDVLVDSDVVVTTYNVISKELHYVMERPDRALRTRPRADPPKSPLDQILWWRVCLDEAQMIESGVSAAATVARLIPRVNAWAVTGTPLRQSHKDLFGLLLFLRYEPWCNSLRMWEHLVFNHRPLFRALMSEVALRHSKEAVRDELRLPPQHRHTITISFTNIEQAHYSQLFYDMYQDCGLDKDGAPENGDWDPNHPKIVEKMRTWLTRLRQTCLHPEVGGRNRKALGRGSVVGPLRTVQQVLDVMIDQNESTLRTEQRNMLTSRIRRGQISENAKLREQAMDLYRQAYEEATEFVRSCRAALNAELAAQSLGGKLNEEIDSEDEEASGEDNQQLTARQRLRSALEVQHICIFFMGNIFFQMKSNEELVDKDSDEYRALEKKEGQSYEEAKRIRGELLAELVRKANRRITKARAKDQDRELVIVPEMNLDPDEYSGIESRKVFEKLHHFCHAMNLQATQLQDLRERMIKFLQQELIDEDEGIELQGDEYENSTKHQDEMYAIMEALRALYADRADAVTGQENLLIRSEMKAFLRSAKEGEGPAPELIIKLLAERETQRIKIDQQGSLRGILAEIRALVSTLDFQEAAGSSRARAELHIANNMLQRATKLMSSQSKVLTGLEQEIAHFRTSMNARLEYYKALQKISDTVAPYREEDVGREFNVREYQMFEKSENAALNKCSNLQAKNRYLLHLKDESNVDNTPRICTICQSEFEVGAITSCGHVFCKEDLQLWYAAHGNCPVCKRRLRNADFFDVTYKPSEMTVHAEPATTVLDSPDDPSHRSVNNSIYSNIGEKQLNEIKNVEIRGSSFGSKVDTICRHLHWIREQDPGSKTIIFSQFREVLDVLGRAFRQNSISYAKCDDKGGLQDFKANPAIECFLLHAKAHSAGLNIVVASHVILCEPLINTAIELQAIARVHRIGQHRATTVWMYLIADTVEESIYEISAKRRLAHMRDKDAGPSSGPRAPASLQESAIDAANSKELQEADLAKVLAPGKNGGELVDKHDLWPCLFGNARKDKLARDFEAIQVADTGAGTGEMGRLLRAEAAEGRMR